MCFKTAKLAAPAAKKPTKFVTKESGVGVRVTATGTREVSLQFGHTEKPGVQYGNASDLRELSAYFADLADKLAA